MSPDIKVSAISAFIPQQSDIDSNRYVYSYTITIENNSSETYQLLSRHSVSYTHLTLPTICSV